MQMTMRDDLLALQIGQMEHRRMKLVHQSPNNVLGGRQNAGMGGRFREGGIRIREDSRYDSCELISN